MVEGDKPFWSGFHAALVFDTPVPAIVELVNAIRSDYAVLITTGRGEALRWPMMLWLNKHEIRFDHIFMRGRNDHRPDQEVKRDLYVNEIARIYDVQFVIDDRPSVCDMWREIGLPLLQVSQPKTIQPFEFLRGQEDE